MALRYLNTIKMTETHYKSTINTWNMNEVLVWILLKGNQDSTKGEEQKKSWCVPLAI